MFYLLNARLIIAAISLIAMGGFTWYTKHNISKIEKLETEVSVLEDTVAFQKDVIGQMKSDIELSDSTIIELRSKFTAAQKDYTALQSRFRKVSVNFGTRDLGKLGEAKPSLVEKTLDNATANSMRCFEILSGSPLTSAERSANKRSEINPECPSLANPNYKEENQ